MAVAIGVLVVVVFFLLIFFGSAVRVLREYERGVIFRLGRLVAQKGPGLIILIPVIDRMVRVDLRTVTLNIPPQEVITRDNVPARVNAVAYFRVIDPNNADRRGRELPARDLPDRPDDAAIGARQGRPRPAARRARAAQRGPAEDHRRADRALGQSRSRTVEIKDVEIPEQMQRAMARQAEAERERRAKIINAEGEYQAAEKLAQAADIISKQPGDAPAALPADADRDRRQPEHHDRLPAAHRPDRGVHGDGQERLAASERRRIPLRPDARLSADCRLTVTVRKARDAAEVQAARDLRIRVFCDEQGVDPALEVDGLDDEATQIVALDESGVIATCRLRYPEPGACKLERMVVDAGHRKLGVGGRLLVGAEEEARAAGAQTMVLNSQLRAQAFYASHGYEPEGETFLDADIEHIRMTKAL